MYSFNNRSAGIFLDGFQDRDGLPVGDTFAFMTRANLYGAAAVNWSKDQLKSFIGKFSSDELSAMYAYSDHLHSQLEEGSQSQIGWITAGDVESFLTKAISYRDIDQDPPKPKPGTEQYGMSMD